MSSLQTIHEQIPELIAHGKYKVTPPESSPVVRSLLRRLGDNFRTQIITAWRFDLKEALEELESLAQKHQD